MKQFCMLATFAFAGMIATTQVAIAQAPTRQPILASIRKLELFWRISTRTAARSGPCLNPSRRGLQSKTSVDTNLFAGHTVYAIVLEIPDAELLSNEGDQRRIGVWAVSTLATDEGGWRSINRVGLPMIHPLFTQFNEDLGNRLNAGRPSDDSATYGEAVTRSIAGVVSANGTAENPKAYAEKVAHRFFPNILPYEVGTPAAFGFAEWTGRSLTDNAPNIMFSKAANTPVSLGIGKESVTSKPSSGFPYVPFAS